MTDKSHLWRTKTDKKAYLRRLMDCKKTKPKIYRKERPHRLGQFIKHPKFGLGFVAYMISENKVEVFFEQGEKILLQNWI